MVWFLLGMIRAQCRPSESKFQNPNPKPTQREGQVWALGRGYRSLLLGINLLFGIDLGFQESS